MHIKVLFKDEDNLLSQIVVSVPEGTTTFGARKLILQEVTHALDYYVLHDLILHLEEKKVIRDSGW